MIIGAICQEQKGLSPPKELLLCYPLSGACELRENLQRCQVGWQFMILVNIKAEIFLIIARLESKCHSTRPWAEDLVGWNTINDLNHFYDPVAEIGFVI